MPNVIRLSISVMCYSPKRSAEISIVPLKGVAESLSGEGEERVRWPLLIISGILNVKDSLLPSYGK